MLVENSHHYNPQLVDKKSRRENLTPLNIQTFLNEIWIKSNRNFYEWRRGQDFLTYLNFQTFLNEIWFKIKLKLSAIFVFEKSPDYNQYPPVRRWKMQARESDTSDFPNFPQRNLNKIKLKLLWMAKGARFSDIFDFSNFLNEFRIEIILKFSERLLFGNSPDYNQYPQLVDKKYRQKFWHLWISKFSSKKFE